MYQTHIKEIILQIFYRKYHRICQSGKIKHIAQDHNKSKESVYTCQQGPGRPKRLTEIK